MKVIFKYPLFYILFIFTIFGCGREERRLEGSWQLQRQVTRSGDTLPQDTLQMVEQQYNFHPEGVLTIDHLSTEDEQLNVIRGGWSLSSQVIDEEEKTMLTIRRKMIDKVIEQAFVIEQLDDNQLIIVDQRGTRYFFRKV